jgi:hypothetical protein
VAKHTPGKWVTSNEKREVSDRLKKKKSITAIHRATGIGSTKLYELKQEFLSAERAKAAIQAQGAVPSFRKWVTVVPDDSWRWWPVETVRGCPTCRCLNLTEARQCQKCDAVLFG